MGLCRNSEGWGPTSLERDFDFTPCFEQSVLLGGTTTLLCLIGAARIWQLRRRPVQQKNIKTRRWLVAKLVTFALLVLLAVGQVAETITRAGSPRDDQEIYSSVVQVIAFVVGLLLTRLNHTTTRRSSTILLTFWPIYLVAQFIQLRTQLLINNGDYTSLESTVTGTFIVVGCLALGLECVGPERVEDLPQGESPYAIANIFSRLYYTWMSPLMAKGASRYITQEDMFDLPPEDTSKGLADKLEKHWSSQTQKSSRGLWKALAYSYGGPFAIAAVLKIFQDLLAFAQPQLLRLLLAFFTSYQENPHQSPLKGFCLVILMFLAALAQTALLHQYFQLCFLTGMRVRSGLISAIYKKALVLSNDEQGSRGDIVNIMSVDAMRLQDLCTYGLIFMSGPFQIMLAFVSLYKLLSWPAFVGVAIMVVSIPLQSIMARYLKKLQEKQMKIRDQRTRLMTETLSNIKSIKLYSWENAFMRMVTAVRDAELHMLRNIGILSALNMVMWAAVPLLVAFATFLTAAYAGPKRLTADVIFPAIALFNLLNFPLAMFANIISSIVQASVSVTRLAKFLSSQELQPDAVHITSKPNLSAGDTVLSIRRADFRWSGKTPEPTLQDIDLTVRKGELVAVMGRVGAGKTSLLSAIVGEMTKLDGEVELFGSVAYAAQSPWIMSATVRDNITFFRRFDQAYYDLVLDACALRPDLALLPQGDETEVGEKGITLSGGQRARISLARAVYARADLYLLDDVLAAVDAHVARHVFDHVIGPNGMLSTKARIHVTNSVTFAAQHDTIHFMRHGIILESGTHEDILNRPDSELNKLITGHLFATSGSREASGSATPVAPLDTVTSDFDPAILQSDDLIAEKIQARRKSQRQPSIISPEAQRQAASKIPPQTSNTIQKEHSEQGQVKREVYIQYLASASVWAGIAYLCSVIMTQVTSVFSNLVLKNWGENNRLPHSLPHSHYLLQYGLFILTSSVFSAIAGVLLWAFCAVRSSRNLHERMLRAVLHAPLRFFESTPQGRIMNLFSRDQYVVDEVMIRVMSIFTRTLVSVGGIFIVIIFSFPLSLAAILPLAIAYRAIMSYYLATSREIKRLDAVSRSPIFAWFQESLGGLSTIRAYRLQNTFITTNEIRVDTNQKCYMPSTSVNRWLAVRLEFVGAFIVLVTSSVAMYTLVTSGTVDAGLVGFVLSYALSTTQSLNGVVRCAGEVETNIVSVERILGYIGLQPEAPYEIPETKPSAAWPSGGEIEFRNYSMRYRPELNRCLNSLNFVVKPGERIGICGRTGAGKSSTTLGLLRIVEADEGSILIDGVDISTIGLHDLRSAISIIPQEPQLFEGTIRDNVDPTKEYEDVEIWKALDQAHLKEYISTLPGGLDAEVKEGGKSLSAGQKQLVCFARALLRHTKVLILDEATSAVDLQTDQAIQDIIRGNQFEGVTMLTIAHRLNTILSSDRILVLDNGSIAELDSPENLLDDSNSQFYSLAMEAGVLNSVQK